MLFFSACLKKTAYAEKVIGLSTDTLITIKNLRKLHLTNRVEPITKSWMIEGVVVGNDEHDNIYKSIIIQDSTGGIVLLLDGTNLYQNYPVGAFLRVRIQNLFLTDYRKMQQLVAGVDTSNGTLVTGGIPVPLFEKHITTLYDNYKISINFDTNNKVNKTEYPVEDGIVYEDKIPEQLGIDIMGLRFSDIIDIYFNEGDEK